jgi:hypothetical protein
MRTATKSIIITCMRHTSAYVRGIRQHTSVDEDGDKEHHNHLHAAYVSAYVKGIRQHTSVDEDGDKEHHNHLHAAYVSIRRHTSAYVCIYM